MKNRTSLLVLAVEILAIIVLHTRKAADSPANLSVKEVPPVSAEVASKQQNQHLLLTTLEIRN